MTGLIKSQHILPSVEMTNWKLFPESREFSTQTWVVSQNFFPREIIEKKGFVVQPIEYLLRLDGPVLIGLYKPFLGSVIQVPFFFFFDERLLSQRVTRSCPRFFSSSLAYQLKPLASCGLIGSVESVPVIAFFWPPGTLFLKLPFQIAGDL